MSITVGIFESQQHAEDAIDRLDALGVAEGAIHVMTREGAQRRDASLVGAFARAFRGGGGAIGSELRRLGADPEEADFYERALEGDAVLLAVEADAEHEDGVLSILREAEATMHET